MLGLYSASILLLISTEPILISLYLVKNTLLEIFILLPNILNSKLLPLERPPIITFRLGLNSKSTLSINLSSLKDIFSI